jgi:hypothetical protein
MKNFKCFKCFTLFLFALLTLPCLGQNGFTTVIPDQPVNLSQVTASHAWVQGHWVPVNPNDKNSAMTGPGVSVLTCDRAAKTCTDQNANMVVFKDGSFVLNSALDEYQVERWNSKEIVAANVGGICRVRNVIKFDLVQKRVFYMQTLSEPVTGLPQLSTDLCNLSGMNLELKDSALFIRGAK